jgi:hypothetical protein
VQLQNFEAVYQARQEARETVNQQLSTEALRDAMRRCFPYPCRQRYTAMDMQPQASVVSRVLAKVPSIGRPIDRQTATYLSLAAVGMAAACAVGYMWQRRRRA